MLRIHIKSLQGPTQLNYAWDDQVFPLAKDEVWKVEASGSELQYIKLVFTNIPLAQANAVIWHGDMAKFIYWNLYNVFGDLPHD